MISTNQVGVAYHGRTVLRGVSLKAQAGKVLALVGPSGCGKSSFLAAINRMHELIPAAEVEGEVLFDGKNIAEAFPTSAVLRRHVGMIFQKPNPFAMSVRRNMEIGLREHGLGDRAERAMAIEVALRKVGLWDEVRERLDRSAMQLSGGQQQRLCIARALTLQPQVLLMDEPCSALDPVAAERVEELIRSMRGKYTIIIVTHNLAQARRLADDVAVFWMRDGVGELIEHGETETLFTTSTNEIVRSYLSGAKG